MILGGSVFDDLARLGVKLKPRSSFWVLRWFDAIMSFFGWIGPTQFWVTLGDTIYYPSSVIDPLDPIYIEILLHERIHVLRQQRTNLAWWVIKYGLLPVPVLFAYCRYVEERMAYRAEILYLIECHRVMGVAQLTPMVDQIVDRLWYNYMFTWPRRWMRAWFLKELVPELR